MGRRRRFLVEVSLSATAVFSEIVEQDGSESAKEFLTALALSHTVLRNLELSFWHVALVAGSQSGKVPVHNGRK
jgi:hypothetical protein